MVIDASVEQTGTNQFYHKGVERQSGLVSFWTLNMSKLQQEKAGIFSLYNNFYGYLSNTLRSHFSKYLSRMLKSLFEKKPNIEGKTFSLK
jgi:hypothetical protein